MRGTEKTTSTLGRIESSAPTMRKGFESNAKLTQAAVDCTGQRA